jgi:hypothetical protein
VGRPGGGIAKDDKDGLRWTPPVKKEEKGKGETEENE